MIKTKHFGNWSVETLKEHIQKEREEFYNFEKEEWEYRIKGYYFDFALPKIKEQVEKVSEVRKSTVKVKGFFRKAVSVQDIIHKMAVLEHDVLKLDEMNDEHEKLVKAAGKTEVTKYYG